MISLGLESLHELLVIPWHFSSTTPSPVVHSRILLKVWAKPRDQQRNDTPTQGRSKTDVKSDERSNSLRRRRVPQNDNAESKKASGKPTTRSRLTQFTQTVDVSRCAISTYLA